MPLSGKQPLNRRHLGEEVTELLRRRILKGEVEGETRLVEVRLADELGISRTPVREALHRLEHEGLLLKRPQGGYTVRPMTPREVEQTVGVREILEAYATEMAARNVTPELVRKLDKNLAAFEKALEKGQTDRLVILNTDFHEILYQAAESPILIKLIYELSDVLYRFRRALLADISAAAISLEAHKGMVDAIREADPEKAGKLCRAHLAEGGRWILDRIEQGDLSL